MKLLERLAGVVAMLLGAIGVIACLTGLIGVWNVRARTDAMIVSISGKVDGAVSKVLERAEQANGRIEATRNAATQLNKSVQKHIADRQGVDPGQAPDLLELESRLRSLLQAAQDWIGFMRSGVDLVEQFLDMLQATSLFVQEDSTTLHDISDGLQSGRDEIEQTLMLADDLRTHLADIRGGRNMAASGERIETLCAKIDASLQRVEELGGEVESAIERTRNEAAEIATRIRRQVLLVVVIGSFLLVWFAVAQFSLAVHGWGLMRTRPKA